MVSRKDLSSAFVCMIFQAAQILSVGKSLFAIRIARGRRAFRLLLVLSFVPGCIAYAQDQPDGVLDLTEDSNAAEKMWKTVYRAPPSYPRRALRREMNGCVLLSFVVGSDGKASEIEVLVSRPRKVFIAAATDALQQYQWEATAENVEKAPVRRTALLQFSAGRRQVFCDREG